MSNLPYQVFSKDEKVKIYIGDNFDKYDISDLPLCSKDEYSVIDDTNGRNIYLDAIIAKDATSRYVVISKDKIFNMKIREIK